MVRLMETVSKKYKDNWWGIDFYITLGFQLWRSKKKSGEFAQSGIRDYTGFEPTVTHRIDQLYQLGYIQKNVGYWSRTIIGKRKRTIAGQLKKLKHLRVTLDLQRAQELADVQKYNADMEKRVKGGNKNKENILKIKWLNKHGGRTKKS